MHKPFAILLLLSVLTYASSNDILRFVFGEKIITFKVNIEVFEPQGIRISIAHIPNLEIFSFHGKVKSSVDRVNGMNLAQDVTQQRNGQWVYQDVNVRLGIGDVISYWVFLQYRGTGQRFTNLSYVVTNLQSAPLTLTHGNNNREVARISTTRPPVQRPVYAAPAPEYTVAEAPARPSPDCPCNEETLNDVWTKLNMTKQKMQALEESIDPLKNKLSSLTEAVDELIKSSDIGTELLLTGTLPVRSNPVEDVRHLLIEKLKLGDLSSSILQAEYTPNGISFEMATSIDKLRILKRSKDILVNLPYKIIDLKGQPLIDVRSE